MIITERRVESPTEAGWFGVKFFDPDTDEPVYWKDTDRVAWAKGVCDHGVPFGVMKEFHADLATEADTMLMWAIAFNIDCSGHA